VETYFYKLLLHFNLHLIHTGIQCQYRFVGLQLILKSVSETGQLGLGCWCPSHSHSVFAQSFPPEPSKAGQGWAAEQVTCLWGLDAACWLSVVRFRVKIIKNTFLEGMWESDYTARNSDKSYGRLAVLGWFSCILFATLEASW